MKLTDLKILIDEAEAMKKAYFYNSPMSAPARRAYEKYHSHDELCWEESGHSYTARYEVTCSAKNVYAKGFYTRDGKKTTLTAIKNSYNRMKLQSEM